MRSGGWEGPWVVRDAVGRRPRSIAVAGLAAALLLTAACSVPSSSAVRSPAAPKSEHGADPAAPTTPPPASPQPAVSASAAPLAPPAAGPRVTGEFDAEVIDEASGIAASHDPSAVWVVNDGSADSIFLIGLDGEIRAEVRLDGVDATDVEDLARGACSAEDPGPCLYVADVGDNTRSRRAVQVHRLPEPAPEDLPARVGVTTATFTYPEDPVDAEALLVDPRGRLLILSKQEGLSRVFVAEVFADGPLTEVGIITIPPPAVPLLTQIGGLSITAGDLAPRGDTALLRTYDQVLELRAPDPATADATEIASWMIRERPTGFEPQGEAIAHLSDGGFVTVSERVGAITVHPPG